MDERGQELSGVYACGWLSRGPSGIIGTNLQNALQVAAVIAEDSSQMKRVKDSPTASLKRLLTERGFNVTDFLDWQTIDTLELEAGRKHGKRREKLATTAELLHAVAHQAAS